MTGHSRRPQQPTRRARGAVHRLCWLVALALFACPLGDPPRVGLPSATPFTALADLLTPALSTPRETPTRLRAASHALAAALSRSRAARDLRAEAELLLRLGDVRVELAKPREALPLFRAARQQALRIGDFHLAIAALARAGAVLREIGDPLDALVAFEHALSLCQRWAGGTDEAAALDGMAEADIDLGSPRQALPLLARAQRLAVAQPDPSLEATILAASARARAGVGDIAEARRFYAAALRASRSISGIRDRARTLVTLGDLARTFAETREAAILLEHALDLWRQLGDPRGEATSQLALAHLYTNLHLPHRAIASSASALALARSVHDSPTEARSLLVLAQAERERGDLLQARSLAEEALGLAEAVRDPTGASRLGASHIAAHRGDYDFYIDLLMQLHRQSPGTGYDRLAFQASERARSVAMLDSLAARRAGRRLPAHSALLARWSRARMRLDAIAEGRLRHDRAEPAASQADFEISRLLAEVEAIDTEVEHAAAPSRGSSRIELPTLRETQQQLLDPDTVLLEFFLGWERSFLWVVTTDSLASFELPARVEIESEARQVVQLLSHTDRRAAGSAAELHAASLARTLLGQVGNRLGHKRLVIVADGALRYVPFAALPAPDRAASPLLIDHEIVYISSAATLMMQRGLLSARPAAPKLVAVLGDPVFSLGDPRLRGTSSSGRSLPLGPADQTTGAEPTLQAVSRAADGRLPRLPNTGTEAAAVAALASPDQTLQAVGFSANTELVESGLLRSYRILHFATHAFLDGAHPELSGVALSFFDPSGQPRRGVLSVLDLQALELPADLVVLSACRTGFTGDAPDGEAAGVAGGFFAAGAARVIAGLWDVGDRSAAELMQRFYRALLADGLAPAAALRQAEIGLMGEARYRAPYYWAGFVLEGDWRPMPPPARSLAHREDGSR